MTRARTMKKVFSFCIYTYIYRIAFMIKKNYNFNRIKLMAIFSGPKHIFILSFEEQNYSVN